MLVTCTRNGCGQQFDPSTPDSSPCTFHPGFPVFHEGLKGWSCCKTNFTDFSEFLAHPGCKNSPGHDATPKAKETKNVGRPDKEENASVEDSSAPVVKNSESEPFVDDGLGSHHIDRAVPMERPQVSEKVALPVTEMESAKKAFAKALTNHLERTAQDKTTIQSSSDTGIALDTACMNNACGKRYQGPHSLTDGCLYHPGIPVFHEGLKYWSCCDRKKFTEFDDCMSHKGCTEGVCKFIPTAEDIAKSNKTKCRYDFVQSGSSVTVTIYAKWVDTSKLTVNCSVTQLEVALLYKFTSSFDLKMVLSGCVDPERSTVTVYGTKVEICLQKADGCAWETLGEELKEIEV